MSSSDRSLQSRLLAGAGGGFIAESLTLPTDVIKVRLQLQQTIPSATASAAGGTTGAAAGRAALPQYSGMWDCGLKIVERESVAGLWKGYTPAILRQVSYSSLMMVLYDPVRDGLAALSTYACPATSSCSSSSSSTNVETSSQSQPSFLFRLAAGGIAGGTSIAVFNPFEVAKTKIQAQTTVTTSSSASQKPPLTVLQVFRDVYKVDGVCGFWAGVRPNVIRTFLVNAAELGTYDQAKTEIFLPRFGDGLVSHVGASGIAGFVSACVSTPVDVVKTRLMNAAGCSQKQYAGLLDAAGSIVREEGPGALYKGFLPICVRKLIWVTAFFVTYERIKKLV